MLQNVIMANPFNQNVRDELYSVLANPQDYRDFQTLINEKCLTLKECGFSSRSYEYNKRLDLVFSEAGDTVTDKKKWVRPSVREFLWLRILERCRKFGLEKDMLQTIKKSILNEMDLSWLDSKYIDLTIESYRTVIEKKFGKEAYKNYVEFLKTVGLQGLMQEIGISFNILDFYLYNGLKTGCNIGFTLTDDGVLVPFKDDKIFTAGHRLSGYEMLFSEHFIFINLWDFLFEVPSLESAPEQLKEMILSNSSARKIDDDPINKYFIQGETEGQVYKGKSLPIIKEEQLDPKKAIIEKELYKYPFQDLKIMVRDGKKVSIKRTAYRKAEKK